MASAIYRPATDGRTYGTYEVDITNVLKYIEKQRKKGIRLTITQVVASALGRSLSVDIPELNAYVKRGRIVPRDSADIFIAVSVGGGAEMTGFPVRRIDEKSLEQISQEMQEKVDRYRMDRGAGPVKNKYFLAKVPWPFRNWLFRLIRFLSVELSIPLGFIGVNPGTFGSAMLSNIGSHGLQFGFAALMPASNLPIVIVMGSVEKKPVVRNNKIVIRDILPIGGVFDHRIVDGAQGGKLAKAVTKYLSEPELLEQGVVWDEDDKENPESKH